jgi:hypothetical protein
VGGRDIAEVHQGLPTLPRTGLQEGDQGPPGATLGLDLAEALTPRGQTASIFSPGGALDNTNATAQKRGVNG